MAASLGSEQPDQGLPHIHCSAEWHCRKHPRAGLIYAHALRITDGGTKPYYLSQRQLELYFGYDRKTIRNEFHFLKNEGLMKLQRAGRGGNGEPNFANIYTVVLHSKLGRPDKCWPLANTAKRKKKARADTNVSTATSLGDGGMLGRGDGGMIGPYPGGMVGTLVYDLKSTKESTNPPQASLVSDAAPSASPFKVKPSPPKKELPEEFQPDMNNVLFARGHNLDLEEELEIFKDLHLSIGNERSNWQSVFYNHLVNAAADHGRIAVPDWIPAKEWSGYLEMRQRIGKGASEAAQRIGVRILGEMREKGQSVAAILSQSTPKEWTELHR